jgi:hypothetical protein
VKSQALILSLLLLLSSAPLVTGIASSQNVLVTNLESNESTEQPTVVSTYSQAVRSALARVSDISQYSSSVLDETVSWVAIGPTPVGESLAHLNGAWLVTLSAGSGLERMLSMKEQGLVESFYPLVEQTHEPRWIPNDPKFSDQWHLVNTGARTAVGSGSSPLRIREMVTQAPSTNGVWFFTGPSEILTAMAICSPTQMKRMFTSPTRLMRTAMMINFLMEMRCLTLQQIPTVLTPTVMGWMMVPKFSSMEPILCSATLMGMVWMMEQKY